MPDDFTYKFTQTAEQIQELLNKIPTTGTIATEAYVTNYIPVTKTGSYGLAIGSSAYAADQSIAFGYNARATGGTTEAIGYQALASGTCSTALGHDALSQGYESVAIGCYAKCYISYGVTFDGQDSSHQRTLLLRDPDHIFFRYDVNNSSYSSTSQYTNGKTLTQLLASAGGQKLYQHEVWLNIPWETSFQHGAALQIYIVSNRSTSIANDSTAIFYALASVYSRGIRIYNNEFFIYCGSESLSLAYTGYEDRTIYQFKKKAYEFCNDYYCTIGTPPSPGGSITLTTYSKDTINLTSGEMETHSVQSFTVSSVSDNVTEL